MSLNGLLFFLVVSWWLLPLMWLIFWPYLAGKEGPSKATQQMVAFTGYWWEIQNKPRA